MKRLRFIFLCALVFALLLSVSSCGKEKSGGAEDTKAPVSTSGQEEIVLPSATEAPTENKKVISREALGEYTLITPLTAGGLYSDAVSRIYQSVSEKYGITLKLSDDFLMGEDKPSGKEIVLGEASRDFVLDEFLPYDSYRIYFSGENIVINGGSPSAIEAGAEYLVSLFEDGGIAMNEEGYVKESEYPLGNLKINGTPINEYKIITKDKTYGTKYAAELLQKKLIELTGFELKIITGKSAHAFYIDGTDSNDGMCHIESDGNAVTLYGTGMSGPYTAVNAMLEMIGEDENVIFETESTPMFTLDNTKKKLEEGALSIGIIGASTMEGAGGMRPLCEFFLDLMKAEYPDAEIKMKNRSIGGKNTTWGLYCLEDELLYQGYSDLFIVSLGRNDTAYGADYNEMALNYQSMVEKIRKFNPECEILFLTYGRKNEVKDVANGKEGIAIKAMLDVAEYYKIPVVDTVLPLYNICQAGDFEEIWSKYIYDTVHPNNVGQELYGNILWNAVKSAICKSRGDNVGECYMPTEPMFPNSKKDAYLESWSSFSKEVTFGTGDEAGWGRGGTVTKAGASISFDFEGIGIEIGVKQNLANAYFILIQLFDENGELVLEREWDSGYYYHLFIANGLEYGKYTLKLKTTKPSEKYPSDSPTFTLTERMIIK